MKKLLFLLPVVSAIILTSCGKDDDIVNTIPPVITVKPNQPFTGLTAAGTLVSYNANATEAAATPLSITGLQAGELIAGIDYRPGTGQLYGVSNQSRLYIINVTTGAATQVGSAQFSTLLNGTVTGVDFNPTVDRIRVVTSTGQNLRIHPETGAIAAVDTNITPAGTSLTGIGYSNNTSGATTTVLYGIDIAAKNLIKFDLPNGGVASVIGSLGATPTAASDFDLTPDNSTALVAFTFGSTNTLYSLNLTSGAATIIGNIGTPIIAIAIPTNPVAYAISGSNLSIFNPASPATVINKPLTGLVAGETLTGLDIRPATGGLYALGSLGNIYLLNTSTGAATNITTGAPLALMGTSFGFDFNPTVDRIRIVSNTGQNLRANPNDGTLSAMDTNLTPGTPNVSAVAYSNSVPGATTTTLFYIDFTTDRLYNSASPNGGVLTDLGPLGINVDAGNGFDIGGASGKAYFAGTVGGVTSLYTINLTSGAATLVGALPAGVTGFTVGNGF